MMGDDTSISDVLLLLEDVSICSKCRLLTPKNCLVFRMPVSSSYTFADFYEIGDGDEAVCLLCLEEVVVVNGSGLSEFVRKTLESVLVPFRTLTYG